MQQQTYDKFKYVFLSLIKQSLPFTQKNHCHNNCSTELLNPFISFKTEYYIQEGLL